MLVANLNIFRIGFANIGAYVRLYQKGVYCMAKYNKDMTMGEILSINPDARIILEGFGMHCCGCPISQGESLNDACEVHGVDIEMVLDELEALEQFTNPESDCDCDCGCEDDCECDDDCDCGCEDEYVCDDDKCSDCE